MHYFAFVQRDENGAYSATLPDFPDCSASAPSWLQLENAIRVAVRVHMRTRREPVPPPTPIEFFTEDSAPPDSCWMQVTLFAHEVQPVPDAPRPCTPDTLGIGKAAIDRQAIRAVSQPAP